MDIDQIPHSEKPPMTSEAVRQEEPGPRPSSRWLNFHSALPNLIVGTCYALAAFRGITPPFMDRPWLGTMMGIEFLVINSFPFMMRIGSFHPPNEQGEKRRQAAFWGLFCLFFVAAAKMGGLSGVISFASLTGATYVGYLLRRTSPDALAQLSMRWAMSFLAFMIIAVAARMPKTVNEWPDHERVLYFGMSYFLVLGLLELSGFYHARPVLTFVERCRQRGIPF